MIVLKYKYINIDFFFYEITFKSQQNVDDTCHDIQ